MSDRKTNEHGVYESPTGLILHNKGRTKAIARFVVVDGRYYLGMDLGTEHSGSSCPVTKHEPSFPTYAAMQTEAIRKSLVWFRNRAADKASMSKSEAQDVEKAIEKLKELQEHLADISADVKEHDMATVKTLPAKSAKAKSSKKDKAEPTAPAATPKVTDPSLLHPELIPLNMIDVEENYRTKSGLSDDSLLELATSMGEHGQRQPIEVEAKKGRYSLVFGHRRLRAAVRLGWTQLSAIVLDTPLTPEQRDAIRLVENEQHAGTSPVEQCLAIGRMLDKEAETAHVEGAKWTDLYKELRETIIHRVAAMVGKSPTWVRDRAYIARLAPKVQALVQDGTLPLEHARLIAAVHSHDDQLEIAESVKANTRHGDDRPASMEDVRRLCGQRLFSLAQVPWRLDQTVKGLRSCVDCPHNSANAPGLFEHGGAASPDPKAANTSYGWEHFDKEPKAGVCTEQVCFRTKFKAAQAALGSVSSKVLERVNEPNVTKGKKAGVMRDAIKELTPEFVKPKALEDRVEARLERAKHNDSRAGKAAKAEPSPQEIAAAKRREAERAWEEEMRQRAKKIGSLIGPIVAKKPGLFAAFVLFTRAKVFEGTRHYDAAKARRAAQSPAMASMLKRLTTHNWDDIVALEKECGRVFGLLDEWRDGPSGMADKIAEALGVEIEAAPTVEDFLPKEGAEKKPASKSTKGKGTPKDDAEQDDQDEDAHAGFSEEGDE